MLWTLALLFLVLWAVGLFAHFTAGGVIHVLLLAAVAMVVIRLIQRRRAV
jgi:hypothetical protein